MYVVPWCTDYLWTVGVAVRGVVELLDLSHCMNRAHYSSEKIQLIRALIDQCPNLQTVNMESHSGKMKMRELLKDRPDVNVTSQRTAYTLDVMKLPV